MPIFRGDRECRSSTGERRERLHVMPIGLTERADIGSGQVVDLDGRTGPTVSSVTNEGDRFSFEAA